MGARQYAHADAAIARAEARTDALVAALGVHLETSLRAHSEAVEERIDSLTAHASKECEKAGTRLLTEFQKWASPAEARAKSHAAALRAMDLKLEALSERVTKLEPRQ
jgi:hypothetical protein